MKIRIHYREGNTKPWKTTIVEAEQIPQVGEYLAPEPVNVFCVVLSLHVLFKADYAAEVFAESVDFEAVQHKKLGKIVWEE